MLRIVHRKGLCYPTIVCDWCGRPIDDAKNGNYEWQVDDDGHSKAVRAQNRSGEPVIGEVFFTHKHCCHPFETTNNSEGHWMAMELACLLIYLENNIKLDRRRAKELAVWMAAF